MPFGDQSTLAAFLGDNNFLVKTETVEGQGDPQPPAGFQEASDQADDLIHQKTSVTVPEDPTSVPAILRNIWCSLVIWFTAGHQGDVSDAEYKRRRDLFTDATDTLDAINNGDMDIVDSNGVSIIMKPSSFHFSSDPTRLPWPL